MVTLARDVYVELIRKADPERIDPAYLAERAFECARAFMCELKKHEHCDDHTHSHG